MNPENKTKEDLIQEVIALRQQLAQTSKRTPPSPPTEVRQQLARSNRLLDELHNQSTDLIQVCDAEGKLLSANRAWHEKLGYKLAEVVNRPFWEFAHPQYRGAMRVAWQETNQGSARRRVRAAFVSRRGEVIHVLGSFMLRSSRRNETTSRGIFQDISDQVHAERARTLYDSIASHTVHSTSLSELFQRIFKELQKVVQAEDLGVAVRTSSAVEFSHWAGPHAHWLGKQRAAWEDLVNYALAQEKPLFLSRDDLQALIDTQKIRPLDPLPAVWMGIPLVSQQQTVGLLFAQNQAHHEALSDRDLKLLDFVSGQVALAIDRRTNEEKLNEQQSRQQAIFESSSHLVWSVDRQHQFTAFNENFRKVLTSYYQESPRIGQCYNDDHLSVTENYLRDWKDRYEEAFRGRTMQFEVKFVYRNEDTWKLVFINPIYREDGSIREVSGIAHDITQRKKSEVALLDSEAKFRTIYESFQDIYFRCRLDGTLTMVSPSVYELTHYETYDVLGKNITNYYLYGKRTKNLIRQLVKQRAVRNFEASLVKEDGSLLQCICNVRLVGSLLGEAREIEGVARDITALKKTNLALRKAKDEAERSLQIKEAFLANMSHEIRTPMNGILNMINLLANTPLAGKQQEYVSTVQESSETLLAILNDILDLSKIEAGKMELQLRPVEVRALFDRLYRLFLHQATTKGVHLSMDIPAEVPLALRVDEVRLLQVSSNLVANAIKFTEPGGAVALRLQLVSETEEDHLLHVSVTDTGIGIAPQNQEVLFKNFSQVDASTSKRYAGTGLGLSIARQLVELMQGEIGVTSQVGEGSTFWFTFRAAPATPPEPQPASDGKQSFGDQGPRVLVVDDNTINRRVAQEVLTQAGCRVTQADSGKVAIDCVARQSFDIILMDIQMPGMNGVEATEQLRATHAEQLPPVVAMTAYSMDGDQARFIEAGLDEYLSKPIRPEELLTKIATLTGYALTNAAPTVALETPVADAVVINRQVLQKLEKYGGPEMVTESLQDFEEEAATLLSQAEIAGRAGDYPTVLTALHTLKGNASTLGIDQVTRHARDTEKRLKEEKYDRLSEDLLNLRASFLNFQRTFHQHYKPQSHAG